MLKRDHRSQDLLKIQMFVVLYEKLHRSSTFPLIAQNLIKINPFSQAQHALQCI